MERSRMPDKKQLTRLLLIFCAVFLVGIYVYQRREKDTIQENLGVTTCKITNASAGYRGGIQMKYSFIYNGKEYTGGRKYFISNAYADSFLGYSFPVAFDKNNPSQNTVLLLPADFHEFNLDFPDSLEWVVILDKKSL